MSPNSPSFPPINGYDASANRPTSIFDVICSKYGTSSDKSRHQGLLSYSDSSLVSLVLAASTVFPPSIDIALEKRIVSQFLLFVSMPTIPE